MVLSQNLYEQQVETIVNKEKVCQILQISGDHFKKNLNPDPNSKEPS